MKMQQILTAIVLRIWEFGGFVASDLRGFEGSFGLCVSRQSEGRE